MPESKCVVRVFGVDELLSLGGWCNGGWDAFGDSSKTLLENVQELAAHL